jgi:tetratricopeptide (TPR) repeat protein
LASGYYEEAVRAYDQVIERNPRMHTNYLGRARALFLAGNREAALDDIDRAWHLCPEDPQVLRLREQIDEGNALSPNQQSAAKAEISQGNQRLRGGDGEGALQHYLNAERLGSHFIFSQFNKAMAATLKGDLALARDCLSRFTPPENSFIGANSTALHAVGALISGGPHQELLRDLQDQLLGIHDFDYSLSPLRHLEEGLARQSPRDAERTTVVFALLRGGGDATAS